MDTKPPYFPIEEKAANRSNLFKFISLRSPQLINDENLSKGFIYHLDETLSHFLSNYVGSEDKIHPADLINLSNSFSGEIDLEKLKDIDESLYNFSNCLIRNRTSLNQSIVEEKVDGLKVLDADKEALVWDNLINLIIKEDGSRLREASITFLVANNFLKNYNDTALVTEDSDLMRLASANVVIPNKILSSRSVKSQQIAKTPSFDDEIDKSQDQIESELTAYETAIEELLKLQVTYINDLDKVEIEVEEEDDDRGGRRNDVGLTSIPIDKIINEFENPLDEKYLKGKVSSQTIEVIKAFDLNKQKDINVAIKTIEEEISGLNNTSFVNKKLSNRTLITGGVILKESPLDNPSTCPLPNLTNTQNIFVDVLNNLIYSTTSATTYGTSGAESVEKLPGSGSLQWTYHGKVHNIGNSAIGLSYTNQDNDVTSLQYGFKTTMNFMSTYQVVLQLDVIVNGTVVPTISGGVAIGTQLKIERQNGNITFFVDNVAIYQTQESNPGDEMLVDMAFASNKSVVKDLCLRNAASDTDSPIEDPCEGVTNLGIGDYLRVEQEICCYVPGEVSHIENILQGEAKERSTRRLRREETTTTFETEEITEKLRDTSTTDRYEMESETSQVIQEDSAFDIGVNLSTRFGPTRLTVDSGFVTAISTTDSNSQSVSYSQEVTSRALDRVVRRVREERVNKIIEEFEENNLHVLDNTGNSDGHVTGLYRWVDKIYKNQVVNYGKRLMLEFMIPEPAKFHLWAMAQSDEVGVSLEEPLDPRENGLANHQSLNASNYAYWASQYGVKVSPPPPATKRIAKSYEKEVNSTDTEAQAFNDLMIPEGYTAISGTIVWSLLRQTNPDWSFSIALGDKRRNAHDGDLSSSYGFTDITEGAVPFSFRAYRVWTAHFNVTVTCSRKQETYDEWKIDTFDKIIAAYQDAKQQYDSEIANARSQASFGIQINGNNPLYNRNIEQQELKKACMQWLSANMGKGYYNDVEVCDTAMDMPAINFDSDLGCYAREVKFFEQAIDWEIMSYLFYPYYWGKQCQWKEIYRLDDSDPIFRGFLQSGMARVVVPVRPNFEEVMMYYMETGEIWNGSEVPTIDDDLYISIVDELEQQDPEPVGEPWEIRVPSALSVLQAQSGAVDGNGLPCFCDEENGAGQGDSKLIGANADKTVIVTDPKDSSGSTGTIEGDKTN